MKLDSGHMLLQFPFGLQVIFPQSKAALKKAGDPTSVQCPMYENAMETQQILSKMKLENFEV